MRLSQLIHHRSKLALHTCFFCRWSCWKRNKQTYESHARIKVTRKTNNVPHT